MSPHEMGIQGLPKPCLPTCTFWGNASPTWPPNLGVAPSFEQHNGSLVWAELTWDVDRLRGASKRPLVLGSQI